MTGNRKDLGAGLLFMALGLLFALGTLSLELGTAFRMGPGFFPLLLAALLILLGAGIVAVGLRAPAEAPGPRPAWQGMALLLAAPIAFGLTVRGLGLLPAIVLAALIAAFASRRMTPGLALVLTVGLTAFCVLVFSFGLGLPLRLFGPWLGQ
jgi:hypothetical protein